jgi:phage gp36-like protein
MGNYATVTNIIPILPGLPQNTASSGWTAANDVIDRHITRAENFVNGKIGIRYEVPFSAGSCPPMLITVTEDIVSYFTYRSYFSKDNQNFSDYTEEFKDSIEILDQIHKGDIDLVGTTGALIPERTVTEDVDLSSNVYDKQSFFDIDDSTDWDFNKEIEDAVKDKR